MPANKIRDTRKEKRQAERQANRQASRQANRQAKPGKPGQTRASETATQKEIRSLRRQVEELRAELDEFKALFAYHAEKLQVSSNPQLLAMETRIMDYIQTRDKHVVTRHALLELAKHHKIIEF